MAELRFGIHLISRGSGDRSTTPFPSHTVMIEDAVRVEQCGFDSVWLPDHFYFERDGAVETYPDCWTLLVALAMRTERVKLGTNVLAATFRPPALLAKMAAALQELASGRFILGLGAGNQPREHAAFGFDFEHRVGRFKEYLPILSGLLRGETVTFEGRYFSVRDANLRTAVPPVPLWVASGGPQMFDLTAQYASGWNVAGGGRDPAEIRKRFAAFEAACRGRSRSLAEFTVCKMTFMAIAPDAAASRTMVDELATRSGLTPEALTTRTLVGTPDEIAAWLGTLSDIGISHHILQIQESERWSNYGDALEFVAREVIPRVRRQ